MRRLRAVFNQIIGILTGRRGRPQDIPKKLDPDTLAKAMEEAAFLRSHAVDVQSLQRGEKPSNPKRADGGELP